MASQDWQDSCDKQLTGRSFLATIGVFDSGIGGLTILQEAVRQANAHHYIYLADSAHAPYGEKSPEWVAKRSLNLCHWLVRHGAQALVVACNTATASAIAAIRNDMPAIPIIGIEPGIKPALEYTSKNKIGVLATHNTLASDKFKSLLESLREHHQEIEWITQAGKGLVPLIESGELHSAELESCLREHLEPLQRAGVDSLVLGCTHYPFLIPLIRKIMGDEIQIIDTSVAVVRQLLRQLDEFQLLQSAPPRHIQLYSTQDADQLLHLAKQLIPTTLQDHAVEKATVIITEEA